MNSNSRNGRHSFAFGGGALGLLAYLAFGLLPSVVYGGFAGVALASGMLGHAVDASVLSKSIVLFGVLVGVLSTAGIFVILGAATGAGIFSLSMAFRKDEAKNLEVEPVVHR